MTKQILLAGVIGCMAMGPVMAEMEMEPGGMQHEPLLYKVMIDRLEIRDGDGADPMSWEAQAWAGEELQKVWIKSAGRYVDDKTAKSELQFLYSRAVAPFWDLQAGWRGDFQPRPERNWLVLGAQGLAPWFFEIDTALFIGAGGRTALRFNINYEVLFTQQLILAPEVELNFHGRDDRDTGAGSGLSDLQAGLRLRYEITRELAPYVGVNWGRQYGATAAFTNAAGRKIEDTQSLIGIRAWF